LGYFGSEDFDLESIVGLTDQHIKTINDSNVYELTLEELVGKERMEELTKQADSTIDEETRP
jgi:hypothetical protein